MFKLIVKAALIVKFLISFIWQMFLANIRVAYYILVPGAIAKPGVISYPLHCTSDAQITVFAVTLSLTPGTLALDVSDDKKHLYIHAMSIDDKKHLIDEIKRHLEQPIMRIASWK
jgi:multicomponent Na+:H+ antiporter subunit E